MKKIIFATTNARKIQEANESLQKYGLTVIAKSVDIDEIQHHDSVEITKAKARSAYEIIQQPVVVQDTSWEIVALKGFPGGYMKDMLGWFGESDWMNLIKPYDNRTILCHEHTIYYDGKELHHFEMHMTGYFVDAPRGKIGNSLEKVVCLHGDKTISQMHDEGKVGSSVATLKHWDLFGKWYVSTH